MSDLARSPMLMAAVLAANAALAADGLPLIDDGWRGCKDRGAVPESCLPKTVRGDRNSPCPCGSGRKFKKCCRGKIAEKRDE